MRILLVTQWFDPEPTLKGLAFARALSARGHEVQVLTGIPNYPGGHIYPGYRIKLLQREVIDGISIMRVPLYPSHDGSGLRRMLNYGSFALSAAVLGVLHSKPADVAYVYHPPATVALPALLLKWLRRTPFICDIQDLWPDTLAATGMFSNRFGLAMVSRWCDAAYRSASRIAVLSPVFKEMLCRRGVPDEKVEVIYNWCEEGHAYSGGRDESLMRSLGLAGRFNIIFAGNLGKAQALDAVLAAAARLQVAAPNAQFVFIGSGVEEERLKRSAAEKSLGNVRFLPRRPMSEMSAILQCADVLLVHLQDDPLFRITIPSKIQAYLAAGRPILAGVAGDAAALVQRAGAGVVCRPEDPESLAEAVLAMFRMPPGRQRVMGENGYRFYQQELSMAVGVEKFERILLEVAGARRMPVPAG